MSLKGVDRINKNLVYDAQKMTTNRDYKTRIVQLDTTHEFEVGADYIISFYSNRMPSNPNYLYFFNSNHNTQFYAKYLDRDKDGRTYYRLTWRTQYPGQTIVADNTCINIFNADNKGDTPYDFSIWDIKLEQGDTPTAYISHPKDLVPKLTLDSQLRLLADGELLSQQSLKGAKGDKGEQGAKGDKGDKPKLTLDSQLRLLADGELLSQQSLKGAKGEQGAKGDKGDKPKLTLDSQLRLFADGELLSQQSLKGAKGEQGAKGDKGDKPKLTLDSQLRLLADGELLSQQSLKGERGETGARGATGATGATGAKGDKGDKPLPEEVLDTARFAELLDNSVRTNVNPRLNQSDQEIDNAFKYIQAIYNKLDSRYIIDITTSGYVTARSEKSCSYVAKNETPEYLPTCQIPNNRPRIRLTLRSDHDALKRQVDTLTAQLAQLQASTTITPILDTSLRREYDPVSRKRGITLHPDYGDWILSSDVDQLHLSFEGLRAEVGRSIYIQTRKRVYLLANGHSFYGLPGTSSSVAVNQWLDNNTTYRFVRADATSWLVTASSSPYPWT